jgi:hypothetical protein
MPVSQHLLHRSVRALLTHTAHTWSVYHRCVLRDPDGKSSVAALPTVVGEAKKVELWRFAQVEREKTGIDIIGCSTKSLIKTHPYLRKKEADF